MRKSSENALDREERVSDASSVHYSHKREKSSPPSEETAGIERLRENLYLVAHWPVAAQVR